MKNDAMGILILIVLPALISIFIFWMKNKADRKQLLKNVMLYLLLFFSFISLVKTVLGEGEYTIFESFLDNSSRTYLHYFIPIFIFCIIIPVVQSKWEQHLTPNKPFFFEIVLSVSYCTCLTSVMNNGMVTNLYVAVGSVVAFAVCVIQLVGKIELGIHNTKSNIKIKAKKTISVLLFWAVSFFLFVPSQLYLQNISEFRVSFFNFIMTFLAWTVIYMIVAVTGCLFLLPDKILNYYLRFIFAMTLCGYLQDNFLNGTMAPLDGTHQSWSLQTMTINIGIWCAVIILFLFLLWEFKDKAMKVIRLASIYLILIHIATLGFLIFTTNWDNNSNYALTTDKMLELDSDNNVVVFNGTTGKILKDSDKQILLHGYVSTLFTQ